jgi:hypothetical protein
VVITPKKNVVLFLHRLIIRSLLNFFITLIKLQYTHKIFLYEENNNMGPMAEVSEMAV